MKSIRTGLSPASRLQAGAQILAAAETTDTTLVQQRMMTFARMHHAYALTYEAMAAVAVQIDGRRVIVAHGHRPIDLAGCKGKLKIRSSKSETNPKPENRMLKTNRYRCSCLPVTNPPRLCDKAPFGWRALDEDTV